METRQGWREETGRQPLTMAVLMCLKAESNACHWWPIRVHTLSLRPIRRGLGLSKPHQESRRLPYVEY